MKINKFFEKSPVIPLLTAARFLETELTADLVALGLSWQGANLLAAIFFEDRACGLRELSKTLCLPSARLSQLINVLEADGLIARQMKAGNARSKYLVLTASGKKLCQKVILVFNHSTERFEQRLGKRKSEDLAGTLLAVYLAT